MTNRFNPRLGCGVGLRHPHYPAIIEKWPAMDWFEAISENYMDSGGRPLHILEKVREHYPVALHGTSLSIGSIDPLNPDYLARLKRLIRRIHPFIVSDHLCWSGVEGDALHDLLPLPFTEEALQHVVCRVEQFQDYLGRRILLENVSSYVTYRHSTLTEWEFLREVAKRSGCGILLDLNNIYVNAANHQFDPHEYLRNIPGEFIGQFHLAGHTDMGTYLFDTHGAPVIDPVWELYREALKRWGPISTLIEWDENIPPFERLAEEAEAARKIYREYEKNYPVIARSPAPQGGTTKQSSESEMTDEALPRPPVGEADNDGPNAISLSQVQHWFKSKIQPLNPSPHPLPSGEGKGEGIVQGEERLAVYANGYLARIAESLKEVYEAVHHVLGSEKFLELCEGYARRFPSRNYNLNYAGRHFPKFLETGPFSQTYPFLPDLARLEWLIWEAFHAFDETPAQVSPIHDVSPEDWGHCRIRFQPSVSLLDSKWTLLPLWLGRHEIQTETSQEKLARPEHLLIGRKKDQVRCEPLDENQYKLVAGLLAGKTLGKVCEELADAVEEENLPIAEWFSRWVQDGLILHLDFKPTHQPTT